MLVKLEMWRQGLWVLDVVSWNVSSEAAVVVLLQHSVVWKLPNVSNSLVLKEPGYHLMLMVSFGHFWCGPFRVYFQCVSHYVAADVLLVVLLEQRFFF